MEPIGCRRIVGRNRDDTPATRKGTAHSTGRSNAMPSQIALSSESAARAPDVHGGEQSNTSVAFDERFMLKLFRNVSPGANPELEIGRNDQIASRSRRFAELAGAMEYRGEAGSQTTIAVLHEYIPTSGDAKRMTH